MPGLINAHTHLSNAVVRGVFDDLPISAAMTDVAWDTLRALDREAARAGAELSLLELMLQGVTTCAAGEFAQPHYDAADGVLDGVARAGTRVVFSRMTIDSPDESSASQAIPVAFREPVDRAITELERLRVRATSDLVLVVPEALGILRCTPDMVVAMHALARSYDVPFFMHIASTREEIAESQRRFGRGPTAQLARLGCLGPKTTLAHAVWLDDDEVGMLAEHATGVAHNPVANASYACGLARLPELLSAGVRVGLGTDGATTNNSQNLWETAKMAMFFQKNERDDANFGSAELALEMMTIGGARALHMEDQIGSLEPGKQADLIVIDADSPALVPRGTLVSNLIYSNDPYAVRNVFVGGVERVRDGVHLTLEPPAVYEEARRHAERVLRSVGIHRELTSSRGWKWYDIPVAS
jgi:5-methylthioadenosine/S-adenosylhomocysteine deaminase